MIKSIDPKSISIPELHGILLSSIAPRPIGFVSTMDKDGRINLSPFSFFNVFSANPPILIFSPARRVKDNTTKHTLDNVQEIKEASISVVNYDMVQQVSLSSTEYDKGVNEFIKAGFTEEANQLIKPPRVKESPVSFECLVKEIKPLGSAGGAGNLVICEVVMIHLDEGVADENGHINPTKINLVGRMGGDWYCRINKENIFKVAKPLRRQGIGLDQLPMAISSSNILSGNDLAMLANVEEIPSVNEYQHVLTQQEREEFVLLDNAERHIRAQKYLQTGEILKAWICLLI
jgi:flavin reductase (DIM6/NTAB) family NADH-FMN oxidoreductase RutF